MTWDEVLDIVKRAEAHGPLNAAQLRVAGLIAGKNKQNTALADRVRAARNAHNAALSARKLPGESARNRVLVEHFDGAVESEIERARR